MKRLVSYADNMIDHHVVIDLVPTLASLFFSRRLGSECTLSAAQQAILLALGLQRKPVETLETELGLTPSQTLALFAKILRRIVNHLQDIRKAGLGKDLPVEQDVQRNILPSSSGVMGSRRAVEETVEEELGADASEETKLARAAQKEYLDSVDMSQ